MADRADIRMLEQARIVAASDMNESTWCHWLQTGRAMGEAEIAEAALQADGPPQGTG